MIEDEAEEEASVRFDTHPMMMMMTKFVHMYSYLTMLPRSSQ